eukprot:scaffold4484_cov170-Amphora_coffeaeformis.AAC.11
MGSFFAEEDRMAMQKLIEKNPSQSLKHDGRPSQNVMTQDWKGEESVPTVGMKIKGIVRGVPAN